MLILSTNVDQKSLETEFSIAICRPTGDKWQSKTLFLAILVHVRRLLREFLIATYPVRTYDAVAFGYFSANLKKWHMEGGGKRG